MVLEQRSRENSTSSSDKGFDAVNSPSSQSSLSDVSISCNYTKLDDEVEVLLTMGVKSELTTDLESIKRYVPIRLVLVIDRSSSMQYPPARKDRGQPDKVTKIDSMKLYTELIVNHLLDENDELAIVTFASDAQLEMGLRDMSPDGKAMALKIINNIQPFGGTNLSAGIEEAINLFCREKLTGVRKNYQNSMVIFSDGDANEGIINPSKLINKMIDQMGLMGKGNHVNITTCASGRHRHNLLYRISEEFSSDAFYFIDDSSSIELDMIKPIILRKTAVASDIKLYIDCHHGIQMNKSKMMCNFMCCDDDDTVDYNPPNQLGQPDATTKECQHVEYYIHDLAESMVKHLSCYLKLPSTDLQSLQDQTAVTIELVYRDLFTNKICKRKLAIPFSKLPQHTLQSTEKSLILSGQQKARRTACHGLHHAAELLQRGKTTRQSVRILNETIDDIRQHCQEVNDMVRSDSSTHLASYIDPLVNILEYCRRLIDNPSKATWAKIKGLASSLEREMPTTTATTLEKEESDSDMILFQSVPITSKMYELLDTLVAIYSEKGLDQNALEKYKLQINQLLSKAYQVSRSPSTLSQNSEEGKSASFNYDLDGSILI
ncbi:hypothetical protein TrispH2_009623 [Trichoplax sp. H2]|nr:hypothetical protein TrispH2_009623 [Trichoplax sp. H2]|eukprot:RDD37812.1 hypothetical protein TrispH2_009623 [Trichoplax sp. H2]